MPKAKPRRRHPAAAALAVEAMKERKAEIARLLTKLQKQVDALPADCHWGHVGDAAAIVQGLKEITLEVG